MSKKLLSIALAVLLMFSVLSVCTFAESLPDDFNSEFNDEFNDEFIEEFNEKFGSGEESEAITPHDEAVARAVLDKVNDYMGFFIISVIFSLCFLPLICGIIIFVILNSKNKKKIKEYERLATTNPYFYNNAGMYQNQFNGAYNGNPNQFYNGNPQNNSFNNYGGGGMQ